MHAGEVGDGGITPCLEKVEITEDVDMVQIGSVEVKEGSMVFVK